MIKIFIFYIIIVIILAIIGLLPILVAKISYKRYPDSKLSSFLKKYIVTDEDLEDYD